MEQRSAEWFQVKCGKVSASRVADLIARTKSGWGASRANYMGELIAQRLTGVTLDGFVSGAMAWGTATEPDARAAYEFYAGVKVQTVGFIDHPSIPTCGASPDGHVNDDGSVEIKCPNTGTHIETLLGGNLADKYVVQAQFQMACSGRKWCDLVSYDPRMPEDLKLFVKRVGRDNVRIAELESAVRDFIAELDAKVERLKKLRLALPEVIAA